MLEDFVSTLVGERLRSRCPNADLDGYCVSLVELGYSQATIRHKLWMVDSPATGNDDASPPEQEPEALGERRAAREGNPDPAAPGQGLPRPSSQEEFEEGKRTLSQTLTCDLPRGPRPARGSFQAANR